MLTRDFVIRAQHILGLNCRQMAALAGVSRSTWIAWRAGRYGASGEGVLRIVDALIERSSRRPQHLDYLNRTLASMDEERAA